MLRIAESLETQLRAAMQRAFPDAAASGQGFDPQLDVYNALRYSLDNELRGLDYYSTVGQNTSDDEVRRLAAEFAAEETEHVQALEDWLARTPRPSSTWQDDPDRSPST